MNEEKKMLVPRLRFPQFKQAPAWKIKLLGKIAENLDSKRVPITESNRINGDIPYIGASGVIDYVNDYIFNERLLCVSEDGANLLARVYPIAFSVQGKTWINNHAHVLRFSEEYTQRFVEQYLNSVSLEKYITGQAQPKLNQAKLESIEVPMPTADEQKKISECLLSLNDLISYQNDKVETLKKYKNGLLQLLFPQGGEIIPRLRFPEFEEDGDWKWKKLSELLYEAKQRNRDLKYGKQDVLSVSGEFGCVNQIKLLGRSYAGVSVHNYHVVEIGDIVYTKSPLKKNPFGIIKENKWKAGIVSTLYAVYRPTKICHPAFLDYYFSSDFRLNCYLQPLVKKGAKNDMKVNNSYVLTSEVPVPPKINEQKRIADALSALDHLIASENEKLGNLNKHKKGLLQQLFPALTSDSKGDS